MIVHFAEYVLDTSRRELLRAGRTIALTPKAFALLEALAQGHPSARSKEELYDTLWPGVFVEIGNLYTLVAEIRSAAGDDSIIRTVHRFGYALGPEVLPGDLVIGRLITDFGTVALRLGENVIGREHVPNPDVSRRHARIFASDGVVIIEDLGSRNGTWVDGNRIDSPVTLRHGMVVMLGGTRAVISFVHDQATAPVDLEPT